MNASGWTWFLFVNLFYLIVSLAAVSLFDVFAKLQTCRSFESLINHPVCWLTLLGIKVACSFYEVRSVLLDYLGWLRDVDIAQ